MESTLRVGVAIYNAGEFHAAHDVWEDPWLDLDTGTADERLLHGLIQFTAAIHHREEGNETGASGLATSARGYLAGIDGHRGVNTETVRHYLAGLDPEATRDECGAERRGVDTGGKEGTAIDDHEREIEGEPLSPPALMIDGAAIEVGELEFEESALATRVVANEHGYDTAMIERAIAFARREIAEGNETSPFVTLVFEFASEAAHREVIATRLGEHVARRTARNADLNGLFGDR